MDIRRLEVFVKLMETRSFSKTAQELHLTQPTVSGHIKTLEERVGLRLFDRHRRQVLPTSAAMVLLDYARQILDLRREAGFALELFQGRIRGRLCLGGSTIPGGYILPGLMGRFRGKYPQTYLSLVLGDTQGIVDQTAAGDVEIGMVGARVPNEALEYEPVVKDEMILVAPAGHPLAESNTGISVRDLARAPFIMREPGSGTRAVMLAALKKKGLDAGDLEVVAEMGSTEAVRQAVKAGLGVSILSRLAVADELKSKTLEAVRVKGLDLGREFFVVTHRKRTRSPVCSAFLEFLRKEGPASAAEPRKQK